MKDTALSYGGRHLHAPDPGAPALALDGVVAGHSGALPILQDVSFALPVGKRFALVGPNGSGKSTLLKTVAGLLPVRGGNIRVFGLRVGACHHRTSYVPQRQSINWDFPLDVRRFTLAGRFVHTGWLRRPAVECQRVVDDVLASLGLTEIASRPIGELSGGQQQRLLLARAAAQESDLLLLDEPLNAVDAASRLLVGALLDRLQRAGKSMIVSTHDVGTHDLPFDEVLSIEEGRVHGSAR
ncbi:MAG: ABC transporter ATP-binding protein [Planctomycetes bacterium]|nr:ABC transporter ATP-binding protein [Planctomycetota bacterium]